MAEKRNPYSVPPRSASDAEEIKRREDEEGLAWEQRAKDLKFCLDTPQARRVIIGVLIKCGILHKIWDPSARIHWLEGRRSIGIELLDEICQASPEDLTRLIAEVTLKEVRA